MAKEHTYENRFGKERADEIKQKIVKSAKRSWNERVGEKKAEEMREKARERIEEYNKPRKWTKESVKERVLDFYGKNNKIIYKNNFWERKDNNLPNANSIKRMYGNLDNMAKEVGITFAKVNRSEYLKENPDVLKKILKNNPILQKGNDYRKRYGKKREKEIKEKLSSSMQNRDPWNKGLEGKQYAWNKGVTKDTHKGMMKVSLARIKYMEENKGTFISSQELKVCKFLEKQNIKYISQYRVYDIKHAYLADIFIPDKKLIIEIDGNYWHNMSNRRELDNKRTKEMLKNGYKVLRFSDIEVNDNFKYVKDNIIKSNTLS